MNFLKHSGNSSYQDSIAEFMIKSYYNNAAQWVCDTTSLFRDHLERPFQPYPKQVNFLNLLNPQNRLIVVLKPRQSGFSTSIIGSAAHMGYFNLVPEVVIVSATRTQAEKILDKIIKVYKSMPEQLRPTFVRESKQFLELASGTKFYSMSSNPDSARGFTGVCFLDEYAMIGVNDSYELYKALYPSTTHGGRIIIVSTPKGTQGKYYDLATKTLKELSGNDVQFESKKFKINWKDVPFIKHAVEKMGLFDGLTPTEIAQEYELSFLADLMESFFSLDFLMTKYVDRDGDLPLFTSYDEMGIPNDYFNNLDLPLAEKFKIENNPILKPLMDDYLYFKGGWDVASKNDDSIYAVVGARRDNPEVEDVIFESVLNPISDNIQTQAKFTKRIVEALDVEQVTIDKRGLGQSASDAYSNDERLSEVLNDFIYTNQSKIDGMTRLKNQITTNKLHRRFDGTKYDNNMFKQATNLYQIGNKIQGKNGKDDYFNAIMLATEPNISGQSGFYIA